METEKHLTEQLISEMSEPSEHVDEIIAEETANEATETAATQPTETQSSWVGVSSTESNPSADEVFDPLIHCVDSLGNPIKTKAGKFRRKPGRKPNVQNAPSDNVTSTVANAPATISPIESAVSDAKQTVWLTYLIGQVIGGPDFKPEPDEPPMMVEAWTDYYKVSPANFPAWMPPLIVTGMYFGKRLDKPTVQERLKKVGQWFGSVWSKTLGRWL